VLKAVLRGFKVGRSSKFRYAEKNVAPSIHWEKEHLIGKKWREKGKENPQTEIRGG